MDAEELEKRLYEGDWAYFKVLLLFRRLKVGLMARISHKTDLIQKKFIAFS